MSIWKTIAKNEIRLATYRFRKNRRLFFLYLFFFLTFWGLYFGPNLLDIFLPEFLSHYGYLYLDQLILYFEYFFFLIFLLNIMLPLYNLYNNKGNKIKEIILASPIKPKEIFFGMFIWKWPFYILFVLFVGPLFTSLLNQIGDLTIFHFVVIYLCIFGLIVFSQLIGNVISNLIEYKINRSQKAQNTRKIRILAISLILIIFYFFIRFLSTLFLSSPGLKNWLNFFPSYWYSYIVIYLIDPSKVSLIFFNIWIITFLAIFIPILFFFVSYKKSNAFYIIKGSGDSSDLNHGEDKKFFILLRKITLNKWKVLVQTHFKEFFRNEEYILKFFYAVVLNIIFGIVLAISLGEFEWGLINEVQTYKLLEIMIVSWIGSILFGSMSGLYIFIESKDLLNVYKKSLRGTKSLVYSILYFLVYLVIFIDLISVTFFTLIFQLDILLFLVFFIIYFLVNLTVVLEMIGIQCLKPIFKDRKSMIMVNVYILIILQIISLLLTFSVFIPYISNDMEPILALLYIFIIHFGITLGIATVLFFLGIRKISKFE